MAPVTRNVSDDHSPISSFLELKQSDKNLFVCESLWLPAGERGVYGGQLIAQSLLAATRSVGTHFTVNSIHCHFLSRPDPLASISYSVKPMREGKTYRTMMVEGRQNERWVVSTVCSFQRPELDQPLHQPIMPPNIPSPDLCPNYEVVLEEKAAKPETTRDMRQALLAHVEQLTGFPIEVKTAGSHPAADNLTQDIFWMRLRAMPTHSISFKKCALAFVSDFHILSTVSRAVGLVRGGTPPNRLSMISSLDHSVWFYDQDFDLTEWAMFVTISPLVGMGTGIVNGRIYTQSGRLIAIVSQEGVVRADPVGLPKASTKL